MGFTIVAILTAALLLPGILFVQAFYRASWTDEITVDPPPLSTMQSMAMVGSATLLIHAAWAIALFVNSKLAPFLSWPAANPYVFFSGGFEKTATPASIVSLFTGLLAVAILGWLTGTSIGKLQMRRADQSVFYGPMRELVKQSTSPDAFINAYVISKIEHDGKVIGYEGMIRSLSRDSDRNPTSVTLSDVSAFYLVFDDDGPNRVESDTGMDWLTISAAEWSNIAYRVWLIED